MYLIDDYVWSIINMFDTPKKTKILNYIYPNNMTSKPKHYIVNYKNRKFTVRNEDIYPTQIDAEIFWAILIIQEYEKTLQLNDFFITDEFEIANIKAEKLLSKYAEEVPHLLLKYL